jgi:glutaredoxin
MIEKRHFEGKKVADITVYALSTCIWCRKSRKLLEELGIEHDVVEVDLVNDLDDKNEVMQNIMKWNPDCSYPTIVLNNKECIVGFDEEKLRGLVK